FPRDNSTDFIKRLVGLPGDRIQMQDGILYINDTPVPKVRVEDHVEMFAGEERRVPRYRETPPNGKSYYLLDHEPYNPGDNTGIYTVPEGHYCMMGDNRDNSDDSRMGVGFVPADNLEGKALFRF